MSVTRVFRTCWFAFVVSLPFVAHATTIDFNSDSNALYQANAALPSERGYSLNFTRNNNGSLTYENPNASYNEPGNGTELLVMGNDGVVTVGNTTPFNATSVDLAAIVNNFFPLQSVITGQLATGGSVSYTVSQPIATATNFATYTLPGTFRNLASLSIAGGGYGVSIDNIVVASAPVAEPPSLLLLGAGILVLSLSMRRGKLA